MPDVEVQSETGLKEAFADIENDQDLPNLKDKSFEQRLDPTVDFGEERLPYFPDDED